MTFSTDFILPALAPAMTILVAMAAYFTVEKSTSNRAKAFKISLGIVVIIGTWLFFTKNLADSKSLQVWTSRPPRILFLPLAVLGTLIFLNRTRSFKKYILGVPLWVPILLQSFRILVEYVLWSLYQQNLIPIQITLEGRNFDVVIGASAPIIAFLIARKILPFPIVILWNVLGIGMLFNVMGTAATSFPGPLHLDWSGEPLTLLATWPFVWIPGFLAPLAVSLHVISIRQNVLLRRNSAESDSVGKSLFERFHRV